MTYSHNSVRNNIKMTTASATKSIRLKKSAAASAADASAANSTPPLSSATIITPSVTAHSNSIASSTNFNSHFQQQQNSSPIICASRLAGPATPNNRQQRQLHQQQQSQSAPPRQRQRHSPQQANHFNGTGGNGGGFFFANNSRRSVGGNATSRSAQGSNVIRQSPATILGNGFSPAGNAAFTSGGSTRKQRRSPTNNFGGAALGGKVSPQQHPLIPTALTHFAGSKCFDAPAPTALPKPPQHWTLSKSEEKLSSSAGPPMQCLLRSSSGSTAPSVNNIGNNNLSQFPCRSLLVKSSKRNLLDDFDTHNLKLLLNVQS